ncbi:MAG TPA: DUF2157 domain-containing protein [Streptosporangiaceae bacterium]
MSDSAGTTLLREQLQRWTAAGLIDADQAGRIEAAELARARAQPQRRVPLVAEVLGYLGAVLAATAIAVAMNQVWAHVPPAAWLAFTAALTLGLLIAGALVRTGDEPAFSRLRNVLWLLATASAAGFIGVLTARFLHLTYGSVALSTAAAWLICAVPLWWRTRSAVQQVATFGGAIALAETGLDKIDLHAEILGYGIALWALAVGWGVATALGYLVPRITGLVLSGAGALTGAVIAQSTDQVIGQVLALLTVAGLLTAGVAARRVLLIGIGAAGTLYVIPAVATRYLPGSLAAPLAVAVVGLVLFATAMWLARHRRARG